MRRKSWEVNGLAGPTPPFTPGRGERGEGVLSLLPLPAPCSLGWCGERGKKGATPPLDTVATWLYYPHLDAGDLRGSDAAGVRKNRDTAGHERDSAS